MSLNRFRFSERADQRIALMPQSPPASRSQTGQTAYLRNRKKGESEPSLHRGVFETRDPMRYLAVRTVKATRSGLERGPGEARHIFV
jgi:hypothetical protein